MCRKRLSVPFCHEDSLIKCDMNRNSSQKSAVIESEDAIALDNLTENGKDVLLQMLSMMELIFFYCAFCPEIAPNLTLIFDFEFLNEVSADQL